MWFGQYHTAPLLSSMARILIIEPFYGGSHKQLLDTILESAFTSVLMAIHYTTRMTFAYFRIEFADTEYDLLTLPAKKWHWRARTSAMYFSQTIPKSQQYRIILTSSVLNLAELLGVRPDLTACRKIVYFHENQLVYPVQEIRERDCQYGLNQIMTW